MTETSQERLAEVILTGGAVCLIGAGYSVAGTDQDGKTVPSTTDLIEEIKLAIGLEGSDYASLSDIADYCEEAPDRQQALRGVLLSRLTLCRPTPEQISLAGLPWRSVFTTNFDDLVERSDQNGRFQVITPTSEPPTHITGKTPLYYMHGRARDLIESDHDPKFVISERNYLQLHEDNKALYARLKNELFCANLIVILGYSLRDLEVASIITEGGHAFRSKTIIVCHPSEKPIALTRLKKFGDVLPIGTDGLHALMASAKSDAYSQPSTTLQFVDCVKPVEPADEIQGDDFVKLILTGSFSREKYQTQIQQSQSNPELYCIRRGASLDAILKRSASGVSRFIVSADLGNGKSLFLDQLSDELLVSGVRVVRISSVLNEVFSDIEECLSERQPTAFLIDDVIRYREVAHFIGNRLNSLSILVCAVRGDPGEIVFKDIESSLGGASKTIDLNRLSIEEIKDWDIALERWGLWEEKIKSQPEERIDFLKRNCGSENRSIVIALFKTSRIASKIDQIVSFFVKHGQHERAFAALLISSLCQQHVTWESLLSWLNLDEGRLRKDLAASEISALFSNGRNWNAFTSAQLAEYILRSKFVEFDRDTLVDVYATIVLRTAESAGDSYLGGTSRENLKELMKFRFLTRLFGDGDAAIKLIGTVYSRLSKAHLIRNNPQFWLQYAMSRIEVSDLDNAETYLNTALGLAEKRGAQYSPFQILDQRARLFFVKNTRAGKPLKKPEISTAIKDLRNLLENSSGEIIYLYRSAPLIANFVEMHIDDLTEEMRSDIRSFLTDVERQGEKYSRLPRSQKGETAVLRKSLKDTLLILKFA